MKIFKFNEFINESNSNILITKAINLVLSFCDEHKDDPNFDDENMYDPSTKSAQLSIEFLNCENVPKHDDLIVTLKGKKYRIGEINVLNGKEINLISYQEVKTRIFIFSELNTGNQEKIIDVLEQINTSDYDNRPRNIN